MNYAAFFLIRRLLDKLLLKRQHNFDHAEGGGGKKKKTPQWSESDKTRGRLMTCWTPQEEGATSDPAVLIRASPPLTSLFGERELLAAALKYSFLKFDHA